MSDSLAFDAAFDLLIGHEGGYVNDPNDPGGETKYGISRRAYPELDIANLTEARARAIYYKDYWLKAGADILPVPLGILVFDAAVNNGVGRAVRWLQEAVGVVPDGVIGAQTRAALEAAPLDQTIQRFHGQRIHFMSGLDSWGLYGVGWSRRLALLPYQAAIAASKLGSSA
jgi:lysozyme family protein